jgi:hypothetical protein
MKPDWEKLMDAFADSATALIGDVDCTTEGKPLCGANAVKSFPTLKWGDPPALQVYKGGRDYDSLLKFAEENLKPSCSPAHIDLCDAEKKADIEKFMAMSASDLDALITAKQDEMKAVETTFNADVEELKDTYNVRMAEKDKILEEIKNSGLAVMKAVKGAKGTKGAKGAKPNEGSEEL